MHRTLSALVMRVMHDVVGTMHVTGVLQKTSLTAALHQLEKGCLPCAQVYLILDEFIMGGEIQETSKKVGEPLVAMDCKHAAAMDRLDLAAICWMVKRMK